jgi:hypothetical protein
MYHGSPSPKGRISQKGLLPSESLRIRRRTNATKANTAENQAATAPSAMKLFLVLASLICNTAAGLAGRLARGLALTATAVLCTCAKILGLNRLNMLHSFILQTVLHGSF